MALTDDDRPAFFREQLVPHHRVWSLREGFSSGFCCYRSSAVLKEDLNIAVAFHCDGRWSAISMYCVWFLSDSFFKSEILNPLTSRFTCVSSLLMTSVSELWVILEVHFFTAVKLPRRMFRRFLSRKTRYSIILCHSL